MFKSRKEVLVEVTVFNKGQKLAFFDIMSGFIEKPFRVFYDKKKIVYRVRFLYTLNFNSFVNECSGLYKQYKFSFKKVID